MRSGEQQHHAQRTIFAATIAGVSSMYPRRIDGSAETALVEVVCPPAYSRQPGVRPVDFDRRPSAFRFLFRAIAAAIAVWGFLLTFSLSHWPAYLCFLCPLVWLWRSTPFPLSLKALIAESFFVGLACGWSVSSFI